MLVASPGAVASCLRSELGSRYRVSGSARLRPCICWHASLASARCARGQSQKGCFASACCTALSTGLRFSRATRPLCLRVARSHLRTGFALRQWQGLQVVSPLRSRVTVALSPYRQLNHTLLAPRNTRCLTGRSTGRATASRPGREAFLVYHPPRGQGALPSRAGYLYVRRHESHPATCSS